MLKSSFFRAAPATLAFTALLVASAPALAYFDNFLSNTIIGNMTQKEVAAFGQTGRTALDSAADGETTQWNLPAAGKRPAIDGSFTIVSTRQDQGQTCREVRMTLERGNAQEHMTRWFCKQPDGRWMTRRVGS